MALALQGGSFLFVAPIFSEEDLFTNRGKNFLCRPLGAPLGHPAACPATQEEGSTTRNRPCRGLVPSSSPVVGPEPLPLPSPLSPLSPLLP
eukprot:COSAG04_NODE_512_length_13248_cov_51.630314_5_plen_91_part_00